MYKLSPWERYECKCPTAKAGAPPLYDPTIPWVPVEELPKKPRMDEEEALADARFYFGGERTSGLPILCPLVADEGDIFCGVFLRANDRTVDMNRVLNTLTYKRHLSYSNGGTHRPGLFLHAGKDTPTIIQKTTEELATQFPDVFKSDNNTSIVFHFDPRKAKLCDADIRDIID